MIKIKNVEEQKRVLDMQWLGCKQDRYRDPEDPEDMGTDCAFCHNGCCPEKMKGDLLAECPLHPTDKQMELYHADDMYFVALADEMIEKAIREYNMQPQEPDGWLLKAFDVEVN